MFTRRRMERLALLHKTTVEITVNEVGYYGDVYWRAALRAPNGDGYTHAGGGYSQRLAVKDLLRSIKEDAKV